MSKRTLIIAAVLVALAVGLFFWPQPGVRFIYGLSPIGPDEAVLLTRRNTHDATYFWAQLTKSDGSIIWNTDISPFQTHDMLGMTGITATNDHVFFLGEADGAIIVRALSRTDGEPVWSTTIGQNTSGSQAKYSKGASLVTDGERVYAVYDLGGTRVVLTALDLAGHVLWARDMDDHRGLSIGRRIVTPKGEEMTELDRATGKVLRSLTMDGHVTYESPLGLIGTRLGVFDLDTATTISERGGVRFVPQPTTP